MSAFDANAGSKVRQALATMPGLQQQWVQEDCGLIF